MQWAALYPGFVESGSVQKLGKKYQLPIRCCAGFLIPLHMYSPARGVHNHRLWTPLAGEYMCNGIRKPAQHRMGNWYFLPSFCTLPDSTNPGYKAAHCITSAPTRRPNTTYWEHYFFPFWRDTIATRTLPHCAVMVSAQKS